MPSLEAKNSPALSELPSIYRPRVPTKPPTEGFSKQELTAPASKDDREDESYIWNRPSTVVSMPCETSVHSDATNDLPRDAGALPSIEDLLEVRLRAVEKARVEPCNAEAPFRPTSMGRVMLEAPSRPRVSRDLSSLNNDVHYEEPISRPESEQGAREVFTSDRATSCVWGLEYDAITMEETLTRIMQIVRSQVPSVAVTANLNYAMLCARHPRLMEFTRRAALVLCDGKPIQWRSRFTSTPLPERVAGSDLIYRLAELSARNGLRIYLYGAAEGVAEKAAKELVRLYPGCQIAGVQCPSFGAISEEEKSQQLERIRSAKPDVLLVALGQPKGEFWIEDHLDQLGVPLAIQVGASFDFVTGNAKRAPKLLQKVGAEWLYRMVRDPKRLGPRYLQNAIFLVKTLRQECIDWLDR